MESGSNLIISNDMVFRCSEMMNPDQLAPGERSASTSNRNFEGRQGKGGRTHLVSLVVAAATAVRGTLSTSADLPPVSAGAAA